MAGPGETRELIRNAVLIAGPTASGKSALALALARREGRIVVNADSMQVYEGLRILAAQPSDEDFRQAPHHLYGHVSPSRPYSVGAWIADVEALTRSGAFDDRAPIFVGGTGLYFRALCEGLSAIPEIPVPIRARWRERLSIEGAEVLHARLGGMDPAAAAVLRPRDGQRVARALEVFDATGRSIVEWQAGDKRPLLDHTTARKLLIEPDRPGLRVAIDVRFDRMMADGALAEARRLGALGLDAAMTAMKAIGVAQLLRADAGEISVATAAAEAKAASRQYAKRQSTWFRHQLGKGWRRVMSSEANAT